MKSKQNYKDTVQKFHGYFQELRHHEEKIDKFTRKLGRAIEHGNKPKIAQFRAATNWWGRNMEGLKDEMMAYLDSVAAGRSDVSGV